MRFTQDGMLVKSMLVPLVDATAVPEVITLAPITGVPPIVGLFTAGLVRVLLVSVWVSVRVTTVLSMEIVPVEVIGPPVRPVPVAMDVTPEPDARLVHAPLM